MGLPHTPSPTPPHLYPQALQLKLYQAFIFSIPILFSVILFLLFYLFYLKRRASTPSYPRPLIPTTFNQATPYLPSPCQLSLKKELTDKLPTVLFDEELSTRDSKCSVCLGEFEMKEELLQVPSCRHVFHVECMHHWLHSNSTCPLCRGCVSVIPATKLHTPIPDSLTEQQQQQPHQQNVPPPQLQLHQVAADTSTQHLAASSIEGSSVSTHIQVHNS
ncbi:PREDICTED: probable E3 ubiquitin-protein ligase RHA4A [Theobroma cacao]|uniref:RING-type E3 ubiquitin transferase n=1 Tax=Theobroma cacao TaxID=3641 RepID=A0AB32UWM5_THECC|nr:PREDICTED: probable E3 ubiquitin-protein ligase RHA4A [Theobroma cacao]